MSDFYTLKKEIDELMIKKAKYEKKMDQLIASREYVVKKLEEDHNITPEQIPSKLAELEAGIAETTSNLEILVNKVKKYLEKMEWILEL